MGVDVGSVGAVIRVRIKKVEPLSGTVATAGCPERAFDGWMELIGAVAGLIGSPHRPRLADRQAVSPPVGKPNDINVCHCEVRKPTGAY